MIRTKKFENLPQITSISPSGKIVVTENGVDKVISFEDFSNLPPATEVWDNPSTTFTASEVNVTDIQSATDSKLLDLKVNTSSKFVVRKDGNLGIGVVNPAARLDISDTVLAGSGSLAGSILNLAQTWNTTGNPTAIKLNVTNTSSGATSNLLDLQVGGLTQFNVTKAGIIILNDNFGLRGVPSSGWIEIGGKTNILAGTSKVSIWEHILGLVQLANDGSFGWSSLSYASNGSTDLALARDAAGTLAQRNGVNPQAFRLYNTYTSSTNFERLNLRWDSNILKIGTEKGGAGGTARNLGFETDGTTRMTITSTGLVGIGTTNPAASLDIQGASSGIFLGRSDSEKYIYIVTSPSTGYTANSFAIWNGITAAWAGLIMQFTENAALIFNRDIQNAYTNIRGANLSEPALNITQTSTGDFLSAGTFRLSKSGNLGIGNTVPAARLDIVDTWNSNISVTGATGTGSVATITFGTQSTVIPVGATVVVSSVNPSGYNGTFVVTASTVTSISYTNSTTATYVSGGLVKQQYDAIRAFVTDTNSDTNSNLLSLNLSTVNAVGENWRYKVDKSGNLMSIGTHSIGIGLAGAATLNMGNGFYRFGNSNGIFILNGITGYIFAHGDTQLWRGRDSVGAGINHILEQRNGANGQTFNVYNTWSAWNNFERFSISAQNAANVIIGTNKGAAGGLARGLEIQTDAATRMTVTSAGNVGIGTSSPNYLFSVKPNSVHVGQIGFRTLGAFASPALYLEDYSATVIYKLGQDTSGALKILSNTDAICFETAGYYSTIAGNGTFIQAGNSTATIQSNQAKILLDTYTTNAIQFFAGTTTTERMRILGSNGNVGIGTTSPNVSLETVGTIRSSLSGFSSYYTEIRADVSLGNILRTSGNPTFTIQPNGTTVLTLTAGATANNYLSGNLQVGNSKINGVADIAYIDLYNPTTGNIHIANTSTNLVTGNILFETGSSATERMRISSAGNLGLGTSAPLAKLDIAETWNSNISVTGASGTGSVATITFATQAAAIPVGATVVVSSVNPSGYNGTFVVTASTVTSISYTNSTSATYVSGGTVQQLFTAVKANITDTASATASKLLDLQVGSSSILTVDKAGNITVPNMTAIRPRGIYANSGFLLGAGSSFNEPIFAIQTINSGGVALSAGRYPAGYSYLALNISSVLGWGNNTNLSLSSPTLDTIILRDDAAILALRNGINPQSFRIYNTFTDATTFERLNIKWDTNVLKIGTEKGASGGTARALELQTDGVSRWSISTAGHLLAGADNTYDIGANGATRPRTGYFGTSLITPTITITTPDTNTQAITVLGQSGGQSAKLQSWGWASSPNETYIDGSGNLFARSVSTNSTISVGSFSFGSLTAEAGGGTGLYGDNTSQEIRLKTGTSVKWKITNTGHLLANTDNTYDIGANGATRPRSGYFGTSIIAGAVIISGNQVSLGNSAGHLTLSGTQLQLGSGTTTYVTLFSGTVGSPLLAFGGVSSSFPAIKRNGAALQIRLADDSANAALETAGLTVVGSASVSGHFSAATKSFLIDHPTKEGKKLQYGVVESNQHSVLVRGKTAENIIELPEEWAGLVHEDSVTVQLTPIGSYQQLFVISQDNQRVVVGGSTGQYNYTIYGERKDVDKLITEI